MLQRGQQTFLKRGSPITTQSVSLMKLVVVAQDFPPTRGGIQTYAVELSRRWAPRCEQFCVIAPAHADASAYDATLDFAVRRVPTSGNAFALGALGALLQHRRATTFHTQWPSAAAHLSLGPWRRGPTTVAAHGRELLLEPFRGRAQQVYDSVRSRTLRNAARVFAVSRYTGSLLESLGVEKQRIRIQANGTDPARYRPHAVPELRARLGLSDAFVFLCVGRLVERKGVDRVLSAFARAGAARLGAHLVIVGDGPERTRLERSSRELGIDTRVRFVGSVADGELSDYYAAADAFVLPARSQPPDVEGFGIVYLEASASGLAVIGPNEGGPVDAIIDGVTGLLVDPSDVDALQSAMQRLLDDRDLCRSLGDAGRRHVLTRANWDYSAATLLQELVTCSNEGS